MLFGLIFGFSLVLADLSTLLDEGKLLNFPNWGQTQTFLNSLNSTCFQKLDSIGLSSQDREIRAYRLSCTTQPRATVLLTSLIHANELQGLTVILEFLERMTSPLTDLPDEDNMPLQMERLLNNLEILVIPILNPDGYHKLSIELEQDPNCQDCREIRKNAGSYCAGEGKSSQRGVDLNRNFPFTFQDSEDQCQVDYSGPRPLSEPETQAFQKFVGQHQPSILINFHSYGQEDGSLLIHPYAAGVETMPAQDQLFYEEMARQYRPAAFGNATQFLNYPVQGEADDYFYHDYHIFSAAMEVGQGTKFPPLAEIKETNTREFPKLLKMLSLALPTFHVDASESSLIFKNLGLIPIKSGWLSVDDPLNYSLNPVYLEVSLESRSRLASNVAKPEGSFLVCLQERQDNFCQCSAPDRDFLIKGDCESYMNSQTPQRRQLKLRDWAHSFWKTQEVSPKAYFGGALGLITAILVFGWLLLKLYRKRQYELLGSDEQYPPSPPSP